MIDFLNANQGFVMAVLTAVYSVATIFICLANIRSAKATQMQVAKQQRQFEEGRRPLLEATVEIRERFVGLLFKNNGGGSAYNIRYGFPEEFITKTEQLPNGDFIAKLLRKISETKQLLLVGKEYFLFLYPIAESRRWYDLFKDREIPVSVTYTDHDGAMKYQDILQIDFRAYGGVLYVSSAEEKIAKEVKGITQELKAIATALKNQPER